MYKPLVNTGFLDEHPDAVIADVRWYLGSSDGYQAYCHGHIPGAVFVDLDRYLAAEPSPERGRHPLPEPEVFAEGMRRAGISDESLVVAYDDMGGMAAARLVWLLRVLGMNAVLLDGGLDAWPGDLESGETHPSPGSFTAKPWPSDAFVQLDQLGEAKILVDARAPERYRGENEPMDPRAGHIPGAINVPTITNLREDKTFFDPESLRARFLGHGITNAADVVVYCGSGVTACHDLIAMEQAGLGVGKLYPGSWSQYAATDLPAETSAEPS